MAKVIKHYNVFINTHMTFKLGNGDTIHGSPDYECTQEPERFIDSYELKTTEGETVHLMVKDISYISWKPVFDD